MIQALYQALQISASLGTCIWDPIYQGDKFHALRCLHCPNIVNRGELQTWNSLLPLDKQGTYAVYVWLRDVCFGSQTTVTLSRINNLPAIAPAIQRELMVELWSLSVPCWSAHEFVWTMVAESACMPLRNHSSMELSQPSEAFTSFYNQNLQSLRSSSHRFIL